MKGFFGMSVGAAPDLNLYVGGEWRGPSRRDTQAVLNPATGETINALPLATSRDLEDALDAAQRGFVSWRATPPDARAAVLTRTAALIRERADTIAAIATLEQGKPLAEARGEVAGAAAILEFHAGEAVRPQVIVCLGATAAQSLLGTTFRVSTQRGQQLRLPSSTGVHVMPEPIVVATVHPSSVLRDRSDHRDEVYKSFVDDLRSAGAGLATRE